MNNARLGFVIAKPIAVFHTDVSIHGYFESQTISQHAKLTAGQQFGFGLLSCPISLAVISVITFVPTYYAIDLGLGLTAVGALFAAGRLLDVITDPLIGHLSDKTRSPWGRRLPWMIVGALIVFPSLYCLLSPSPDVSIALLACVVAAFFLGLTLLDLPYSAVGLEISPYAHERTTLAAVKAVFQIVGALSASIFVVIFAENLATAFQKIAVIVLGFIVIGLISFCVFTPYRNQQEASFTQDVRISPSVFKALLGVISRSDYMRLLFAFGLAQAGSAMTVGLTALLVLKQIQAPELTGLFIALLLISTALSLPVWSSLSRRLGKRESWIIGLFAGAALMLASFLFVGGNVWLFGLFSVLFGACVASDVILPTSMLADIVSDKSFETAENPAGLMLGFKNAVSKMGFVLPMLVAFPILGALDVEAAETLNGLQTWSLLILYGGVPALLRVAAWWVLRSDISAPSVPIRNAGMQ